MLSKSLVIILIIQAYSILPDGVRKELLNKFAKEININDNILMEPLKQDEKNKNLGNNIKYNITKINEILEKYDFPQNFDFFEDNKNIKKKVKDQQKCGGCWAFASTSALAYRFEKKYNIELNLSPQDSLSCYIKDCYFGNYGIDAQLNLLINGSLTENCFPFASGENPDFMPACPSTCEDHSLFKRYFSKSVYTTEDKVHDNREEDLYDFITLIIDQLITKGPVVTNIEVYDDFQQWCYDALNCKNDAYSPDPDAESLSGHAMVIVGYGFLKSKNKYYWLIQNSWGEEACDKGFLKIEFGKVGVEKVAFAEPYYPEKEKEENKTLVDVIFQGFDNQCNLIINTTNNLEWNNTLQVSFKSEKDQTDFNYYCNNYDFPQGNSAKCFFEILNYIKPRGNYIYDSFKSLGNTTKFDLDPNFINKKFYFWGWSDIAPYIDGYFQDYYISSEGSKLIFWYSPDGDDSILPSIYPFYYSEIPLKKCEKFSMNYYNFGEEYLIICDIQKDEMDYFHDYDPDDSDDSDDFKHLMFYDILCGEKENSITYVYKIDKNKYPIFNITDFFYVKNGTLSINDKLIIYANISGDISNFKEKQSFISFINFTNNDQQDNDYYTLMIQCFIDIPKKIQSKYKIECKNDLDAKTTVKINEIYLLPYIIPYEYSFPLEVRLNQRLKGKSYNKGTYNKLYLIEIIWLLLLFI